MRFTQSIMTHLSGLAFIFFTWTLIFWSRYVGVSSQDIEINKADWLDPSDMLYYDDVNKKMLKEENYDKNDVNEGYLRNNFPSEVDEESKFKITSKALEASSNEDLTLVEKLKKCQEETNSLKLYRKSYDNVSPFMKRFMRRLLKLFPDKTGGEELEVKLHLKLTKSSKKVLEQYCQSSIDNLNIVDDILSQLLSESSIQFDFDSLISGYTDSPIVKGIFIVFLILAACYLVIKAPFIKVILIIFVISFFWNWKHLYEIEVAERDAVLSKLEGLPIECKPSQMTWSQSLGNWFNSMWTSEDTCVEVHKVILVDPFWDVSPALALSDTISRVFLHPLSVLGEQLGKFFKQLHKNLPPFVFWILVPLMVACFPITLLISSGYNFNFFYGLMSFTRPSNNPEITAPSRTAIQQCNHTRIENLCARTCHKKKEVLQENLHCLDCERTEEISPEPKRLEENDSKQRKSLTEDVE